MTNIERNDIIPINVNPRNNEEDEASRKTLRQILEKIFEEHQNTRVRKLFIIWLFIVRAYARGELNRESMIAELIDFISLTCMDKKEMDEMSEIMSKLMKCSL